KVTDIYATSSDYDVHSPLTKQFFATVMNKLHWAVHHNTAVEGIEHIYIRDFLSGMPSKSIISIQVKQI
ncbi:MAG: virulence RhuM family protein, partial [Prevotellaceae bacterium]|nr:virulence RhuM family protein [Prevotellaceae bacterium]